MSVLQDTLETFFKHVLCSTRWDVSKAAMQDIFKICKSDIFKTSKRHLAKTLSRCLKSHLAKCLIYHYMRCLLDSCARYLLDLQIRHLLGFKRHLAEMSWVFSWNFFKISLRCFFADWVHVCVHIKIIPWKFRSLYPNNSQDICLWSL